MPVYTYINNYMQFWSYRIFQPKSKNIQSPSLGIEHQLGQLESGHGTI